MEQKKRLQYMDMAKGIGVLLVILGHMPSVVPEPIRMWIFSFHMPLFYLISGYFAKTVDTKQLLFDSIVKKFKKLIIFGYFAFGLSFLFGDVLLQGHDLQWWMEIEALLRGRTTRIIWFFLSLFIVEVLFLCIIMLAKTILSQLFVCALVVIGGYVLGRIGWNDYRIGSSLYAYGFYYIGWLCNRYNAFTLDKQRQAACVAIALLVNVVGTVSFMRISSKVLDINCNMNHDIIANYLIALGGSYVVMYLSLKLCKEKGLLPTRTLCYVGKNSFFFFPITHYVPGVFATITHNGNVVVKLGSYIFAFILAAVIAELCSYLKFALKS